MVVARIMASASAGVGDGGALAAIETAARWWGSGLASATVKPEDNLALKSVSPLVLDAIGRALCRSGESLHMIDVRNGQVTLTPISSWEIRGSDDPSTWTYRCTLSGPSSTRTFTLDAASVVHIRYAPAPSSPWAGRSPCSLGRGHGASSRTARDGDGGRTEFYTATGNHSPTPIKATTG